MSVLCWLLFILQGYIYELGSSERHVYYFFSGRIRQSLGYAVGYLSGMFFVALSQFLKGLVHKTGRVISTFDPAGILFAVGSDQNLLSFYDLRTFDKEPFSLFHFNRSNFEWKSLEFNYNGRYILGLTSDSTAFLIDAFSGSLV